MECGGVPCTLHNACCTGDPEHEGQLVAAAPCAACGETASLPHMNCANIDCNKLFLACHQHKVLFPCLLCVASCCEHVIFQFLLHCVVLCCSCCTISCCTMSCCAILWWCMCASTCCAMLGFTAQCVKTTHGTTPSSNCYLVRSCSIWPHCSCNTDCVAPPLLLH